MHAVYVTVLAACTTASAALVAWRLASISRRRRANPARLLNEWAWTLIPLLVLATLFWQALKMSK